MAGRAQAFSDPTVIQLASEHFVPIAENCSPLQSQQDAKGEFFRFVAEQGHYAGRTFPTGTRQGYYAFTPDGRLLAAINSRDARDMEAMLRLALRRWHSLVDDGVSTTAAAIHDYEPARPDRYPTGGLVLRCVARDLPREVDTRPDDWRKIAWNLDYAWFSPEEASQMVPDIASVGARKAAPWAVIRRLGRFHLRDFVRGEPSAWPEEAIRAGELVAKVTAVDGDLLGLSLSGAIRLEWQARWTRPNDGSQHVSDTGLDAVLSGEAEWDRSRGAFTAFELLAAGPRWGTHQYNNRMDDLGPAPLGIAFTLAGAEPRDRTPPHQVLHRDYWEAQPGRPA